MKNYAQKINKQMTRYRTSSTFRGNVNFTKKPLPQNLSAKGKPSFYKPS